MKGILGWRISGAAVLLLGLAACEDETGPDRILSIDPSGPIVLSALGDTVRLTVLSSPDSSDSPNIVFASSNPAVVTVNSTGLVRAVGNGVAKVTALHELGIRATVRITVSQAVDSLHADLPDSLPITSVSEGAPVPVTCAAFDRNGFSLPGLVPDVSSATGIVTGADCASLVAETSGHDTLTITAGEKSITLPLAVTIVPQVSTTVGEFASLDSFPFDFRLWAPSGRTNSQGETEIYVTGYEYVLDSNGVGPGDLHRLVSSDGVNFQYDGIALQRLPPPCELICSGIENIAVVPRDDGPGWRMYFAAGSSGSYGWQLFSAVSPDERSWTIEPGVRITNGGPVPPAPPGAIPWPVGEGMVVDQLPGGEWRMVVGGYDRIPNSPNRFEIVEYRSDDQLNWTYQGTMLTTAQFPATAQRSIYSPSIVEFKPGFWRMFLTGDDLNVAGGRSRVFTAVSLDRENWEFEAEILGAPGTNLWYTALVGSRLYFLRQDAGQLRRLASVTLTMP